jgi:HEAT repeat protein
MKAPREETRERRIRPGTRGRIVVLLLLGVAATCRPPDLTASGGCIPWTERTAVRAAADAGDVPAATVASADAAAPGSPAAPVDLPLPDLRVRLAVRAGVVREGADPVGRNDLFFSQLAAALGSLPLFESDPAAESLAERWARAGARRRQDITLSDTRTSGLEPLLVVSIGLLRPAAGAPVREPTYVVALTLAMDRAAESRALEVPPAVAWELELPARAVRSERLVSTVAQAIEARALVETDRHAAEARRRLEDPLLATRMAEARADLARLGPVAWGELVRAIGGEDETARRVAAAALADAGDPDLVPAYAALLPDPLPEVRLLALAGLWRATSGRPPSADPLPDGLPDPPRDWRAVREDTTCRLDPGDDWPVPTPESRRAVLDTVLEAIRDRMDDEEPGIVRAAVAVLAGVGDPQARVPLREALRRAPDEDDLGDILAVALGRLGDRSVAPRLRTVAAGDDDLAAAAAALLASWRDRAGDARLLALLGDEDPWTRCTAAEALRGSPHADLPAALVPLLAGAQPPFVARAARETLVALGSAALPQLLAALDHPDPTVAWAAAEAIGAIGDNTAVAPLAARLPGLDAALRDYLVDALGRIGDVRAIPPLVAAFGGQVGYRNEAPIVRALLLFGRRALPALIEGLASEDAAVRAGALEVLRRLADTDHLTAVLPLLDDADPSVRMRAAGYVAGASGDLAVSGLAGRLDDPDAEVAAAAAAALGAVGGSVAREALERALAGSRPAVVVAAGRALAAVGETGSIRPLLEAAVALSTFERGRLVEALVSFGEEGRGPLVEALAETHLRAVALEVLDAVGAHVDPARLAAYRTDERPIVRERVARLIGRSQRSGGLELLADLLADDAAAVREAAVAAVAELGGAAAPKMLRDALDRERDEWVARSIRRALLDLGTVP